MQSGQDRWMWPACVLAGVAFLPGSVTATDTNRAAGGDPVGAAGECTGDGVAPAPEPRLIHIFDGLGEFGLGDPTAFVWPKSRHVGCDTVEILVSDDVTLLDWRTTSTGGAPPSVVCLEPLGDGHHRVRFDGPIELKQWTTVKLAVASRNTCRQTVLCFQIAHLPGDALGDGQVNLADATVFGLMFKEGGPLETADLNGDAQVNLGDATLYGQIWRGASNEGAGPNYDEPWTGKGLPPRPPQMYTLCISNNDCGPASFCAKEAGDCAGIGVCYERPDLCPAGLYDPVCGCDGQTYDNACEAAAAGVNVMLAGECPVLCFSNDDCDPASFCAKDAGDCVGIGVCYDRPDACPAGVYDPVCGCDGQTYDNACEAAAAGVNVTQAGECP